jgi:hypothetical protein
LLNHSTWGIKLVRENELYYLGRRKAIDSVDDVMAHASACLKDTLLFAVKERDQSPCILDLESPQLQSEIGQHKHTKSQLDKCNKKVCKNDLNAKRELL